MKNTKVKILAIAVCTAIVAVLGLVACDSSSSSTASNSAASTSESSSSSSTASSSDSSSSNSSGSISKTAEELFSNWLQGTDSNGVVYVYADDTTNNSAMLLVYDSVNDTFTAHTGKLEKPAEDTIRIDTKGAGDVIEFKTAAAEGNSGVVYTFANGSSVTMGPVLDAETKEFLRSLDEFASEVDKAVAEAEKDEATAPAAQAENAA